MSPFVIFIIVIVVVALILWATKIRTKKVEDRNPEWSAAVKCQICQQENPPQARFCANCGATLVTTVEPPAPVAVPAPQPVAPAEAGEHMGFLIRFGAWIIDFVIVSLVSFPLSRFTYMLVPMGVFGFLLPLLYYWLFTGLKGQTSGKMLLGIKVVTAQGDIPGLGVAAMREILGKLISAIVIGIGFLWIAWDREKQGWHDKIAGTYVVKVAKAESQE